MARWWWALTAILGNAASAQPLDRPIVGAVFFYWYEWDREAQWGNWLNGVHNTPLDGYYDSRKLADNFRSILLAADWGITHLFLDYWGHDWRGENNEPRETTVLKAAEKVRALGYPIFVGYYQDGENFAMREFWRNISERRDTYRWLRDYARSPAWTWLFGKPFQMVYARNGVPELTVDHNGFQEWLQKRYGSIERLNAEWGTHFRDFADIRMDFNAVGFQRAMSIAYQYERWQQDWAKLEQLVRDEVGLPGLRASFDVGYFPFRNWGFERFARVFGGPHSYAGIFGQPHEQDAERFLQAAVARRCGSVFFDHLKHRYFDWNIRVPGTAYPPEPHHFDRFWVGNLMRFVDGVLHLSWNEWWEGSNLEPSMEGGKRFCETNLLYSTLWQVAYKERQQQMQEAVVGLLVNDWIFEHGGGDASDLYNAVQGLRAVNAPFDIVCQSEATLERLQRVRILVAPAGGVGFGFNGEGERIDTVLQKWLRLGGRTLIASQGAQNIEGKATGKGQKAQQAERKADWQTKPTKVGRPFNFFADIGGSGEEVLLVCGFSGREHWGKLPEGAFGAGSDATVRWTPAVGNETVLLLPAQPHTDLLLRWHGNAIWSNRLRVLANGEWVAEVAVEPGWRLYEVRVPAEIVGNAATLEVCWQFAEAHIPGEKDPQRFRGEQRVCNLALDWVQVSTPEVPAGERRGIKWRPIGKANFVKPLSGEFRVPLRYRRHHVPSGKPLSNYRDGFPRDLLVTIPSTARSSMIFVNGVFTDDPRWWATVLEGVAKVACGKFAQPVDGNLPDRPEVISAVLTAGTTRFLLVENRTGKPQPLRLHVPPLDPLPVSEIVALSRDGKRFVPVVTSNPQSPLPFLDTVHYYAAYQIIFAPVRLTISEWLVFPGQKGQLPITVQNLTDQPVKVTLRIGAVIASVVGAAVTVQLQPKGQRAVRLPVAIKPFADWGVKTVILEGSWEMGRGAKGRAVWLRPITVGRNAQVRCVTTAVTSHTPMVTIINAPETPFGEIGWWHPARQVPGETAKEVEVVLRSNDGRILAHLSVGDLRDGEQRSVCLPLPFADAPTPSSFSLSVQWRDSAGRHEQIVKLVATLLPERLPKSHSEQVASIVLADSENAYGVPLSVPLPPDVRGNSFVVRFPEGITVPTHFDTKTRTVHFLIPPKHPWRVDFGMESAQCILGHGFSHVVALCRAQPAEIPSLLTVTSEGGGVRVDNGVMELEWQEEAGGTLIRWRSKATGRDYAAQSCGAGIGIFGQFNPQQPAIDTARFVVDNFVWQRNGRAKVRVVERNPVWVTVEVTSELSAEGRATGRNAEEVRVIQRYRIFAGVPLVELSVEVTPLTVNPREPSRELVVLEGRFSARWWTKSFPNFVGLGDKPPEVYGRNIVHFGWRMGEWVPPVLCLFNPEDLTETLSLLIAENDGATSVRQGFWGGLRGKPTTERRYATVELLSTPDKPVRVRLWLLLHKGAHKEARQWRKRLLQALATVGVVEGDGNR